MRAVFASHNAHKAEQVAVLLPDVELVPLDDLVPGLELPEPFDTFLENALNKARIAAAATGLPAIADDSGIEVDALDGAPGVFSARFAGPGATDAENNLKLVDALKGVPDDLRTCRYRCVAVLVTPEGDELVADGACEGRVVDEPRGSLGFGYDPHVVPEGESRTMGEIPLEEKLEFSHRGRAFRALVGKIELLAASRRSGELRVRRGIDSITTSSVDADPFVQFAHWLDEALANETGEPNAMTLATSSSSGDVSARTVLLRGFDRGGFEFFTNRNSRKGKQVTENPKAALVFHWGALQRQVTITGTVVPLPDEESDRYFASRPRGHQIGAWASDQSERIDDRAALEERVRHFEAEFGDRDVPRPSHWGGFRVVPDRIEFWQGRPDRLHDRLLYVRSEDGWRIERLAP